MFTVCVIINLKPCVTASVRCTVLYEYCLLAVSMAQVSYWVLAALGVLLTLGLCCFVAV